MFRSSAFAVLIVVIAAIPTPAGAQQPVGLVDVEDLLLNSDRGKEIQQQLRGEFAAQLEEMRRKEEALAALRSRLVSEASTLSPEALAKLQRDLEDSQLGYQRLNEDAERDVEKRKAELYNVLQKDVLDLIEEVRTGRGMAMVFAKRSAGVVAADPSLDITSEVMQRLNTKP